MTDELVMLMIVALNLTPKQGKIVQVLITHPLLTTEILRTITSNGEVTILRLRKKLRKYEVEVTTHYGAGFSITRDDKIKLLLEVKKYKDGFNVSDDIARLQEESKDSFPQITFNNDDVTVASN